MTIFKTLKTLRDILTNPNAYGLRDLPHDFLKALRTRQLIVTRGGWDWSRAR